MRTVTVEDNKIVVEVDGAKVRYSLEIVRKRINSLLQDLEEWRKYERLLTQRALDGRESSGFCEKHVVVFSGEHCPVCAARQ